MFNRQRERDKQIDWMFKRQGQTEIQRGS